MLANMIRASQIVLLVKNPPAMQETPVWFLGQEGIGYPLQYSWSSLVAQLVKNLPAMREPWVRSLGWEDPLEKGKATHPSILAWRIPWTVHGVPNSWTQLSDFHFHFPRWLSGKESTCNAGDVGSIPGSGRSPGEGNGNPFQYSYLENPRAEELRGL